MTDSNSSGISVADIQQMLIIIGKVFSLETNYCEFSESLWDAVRVYLRDPAVQTNELQLRNLLVGYNLMGRIFEINVSSGIFANGTRDEATPSAVESAGTSWQLGSFYDPSGRNGGGDVDSNEWLNELVQENVQNLDGQNDYLDETGLHSGSHCRLYPSSYQEGIQVNPDEMMRGERQLSQFVLERYDNNDFDDILEDPLSCVAVADIKVDSDTDLPLVFPVQSASMVPQIESTIALLPSTALPTTTVKRKRERKQKLVKRKLFVETASSSSPPPLQTHVRQCRGDAPTATASCTTCGKPFGTASELVKHSTVHASGALLSQYRCSKCFRGFKSIKDLRCHLSWDENCREHATAAAAVKEITSN